MNWILIHKNSSHTNNLKSLDKTEKIPATSETNLTSLKLNTENEKKQKPHLSNSDEVTVSGRKKFISDNSSRLAIQIYKLAKRQRAIKAKLNDRGKFSGCKQE